MTNQNHCVPDFDIQMNDDHQYSILSPSGLPRQKKPSIADDDITELLWHNGQVVVQTQNHRSFRKPPPPPKNSHHASPAGASTAREIRPLLENSNPHLFIHEGEMASWLHYPIDDDDPPLDQSFGADFLYSTPTVNNSSAMQTIGRTSQLTELRPMPPSHRPPVPPPRRPEQRTPNFAYFSGHNTRAAEPRVKATARESTVVDSCDTPAATAAAASRVSETVRSAAEQTEGGGGGAAAPSTSAGGGRSTMMCDLTLTSSPGGSSSSGEPVQVAVAAEDRKRKGREAEEWECQSEDADFESEAKNQVRGSTTSTKRLRAAEVHNLSERRRRDRINEKMRALQELIPRCNKSDKASMLDEAISYLKSLQLQVQMMSMGCGMVPMMFPGIQQYMPAMGMGVGMGMGMGMGMEMGMNRPVIPFPNMLPGSALPAATSTAAAHLGPRFPMPPFHMPHVPPLDLSTMQAVNNNTMIASAAPPDPNQTRIPNFTDPYQQYLGPHQVQQFQLIQNQAVNQPNVNKPSTSKAPQNPENH